MKKTHLERITGIKRDPSKPLTKKECREISRKARERLDAGKVPRSEIERAKTYVRWYKWRSKNERSG